MYTQHEESSATVEAAPNLVFAALDDPARLSSHMSKSSWQMGGGSMETIVDERQGKAIGSHIKLRGRVLGIGLSVEEVVTVRDVPARKVWETIGAPRLLVIGPYRMSFEVTGAESASRLRVSIDYELPARGAERVLGRLFGRAYARWCTRRMVRDAVALFAA